MATSTFTLTDAAHVCYRRHTRQARMQYRTEGKEEERWEVGLVRQARLLLEVVFVGFLGRLVAELASVEVDIALGCLLLDLC